MKYQIRFTGRQLGAIGIFHDLPLREHSTGAIISEDSQGFVSVEYFDNEDAMKAAWFDIVTRIEADVSAPLPCKSHVNGAGVCATHGAGFAAGGRCAIANRLLAR